MKKHSLGFKFHLLILYLVSITLVDAHAPSSRSVINLPNYFVPLDVSNIQRYLPGPGKRTFDVPGPGKRTFHIPGPGKRTFDVPGPGERNFDVKGQGKDGPSVNPISLGGGAAAASGGWINTSKVVVSVAGSAGVVFFIVVLSVYAYQLGKRKGSSVLPYQNTSRQSECDQVDIRIDGYGGVSQTSGGIHVEAGNKAISIQDLATATNNFSHHNILGRGGSGTVYKGELPVGTKIAVKRLKSNDTSNGLDEFQSELAVLTKVRHRRLVALLGYCLDGNERLLVYEYMPQGTLSRFLFDWQMEGLKPLEWTKRLIIALDVARGVEYLHGLAQQSFIHRDLKPSNILLDDNIQAKVSDFGLVRPAPQGDFSLVTTLAGTFGYLAPEYAGMGRVTTKIDVFSFGVILMELITGQRALDARQEKGVHLMQWFQIHIDEGTFREAIDPTLDLDEEALAGVSTVAKLASHCCASEPHQRPDMNHVVNVLSSLAEPWNPSIPDANDAYGIGYDD